MLITMSTVPSYFPIKNVPSIDNTSQQYLNASSTVQMFKMHGANIIYEKPSCQFLSLIVMSH
jgi:hypothetical protein